MTQNGPNRFLYASVFSVNLISINAGSILSWSYSIFPRLTSNDPEANPLYSPITPTVAISLEIVALAGCMLGALVTGFWSRQLGAKRNLILFSSFMFVGHLMCGTGKSILVFLLAIFFLNLGVGCVLTIVPSFVTEISEDSNRGRLGCMMGTMLTIGVASNHYFSTALSMKLLCIINLVPLGIFYYTFMPYVPESPYLYAYLQDVKSVERSLNKYRTKADNSEEVSAIMDCAGKYLNRGQNTKDIFKSKAFFKGLIVTCGLLFFQMYPGYSYILYITKDFPQLNKIIFAKNFNITVSGIQVLTNIFVMLLVETVGRKPFLIVSAFGSSITLMVLGLFLYLTNLGLVLDQWFSLYITCTFLFIIIYNLGFSSMIWAITGEIFPLDSKPIAMCISVCIWSLATCLFGFLFPYIHEFVGLAHLISFYGFVMILAGVFVVKIVPETKGKSLLKVDILFGR